VTFDAVNAGGFPLVAPRPASVPAPDEISFAIVVAAYNAAATIAETLESAFGQTHPPAQVVVCDDGSTDDTAEVVSRFPRATLVRQANQGDAGARNAALAQATTSHVVVLDADDVLEPRCLEAYAAALTLRPDLGMVTCDAFLESEGVIFDRYYRRVARFVVEDQRLGALHQHFVFGFPAIRRELLVAVGGWSTEWRRNADTDLFLRLILAGAHVGLVYEPLARYRLRQGSLSADRAAGMRAMVEIVERALGHPSITPDEREVVVRDLRQKEKLTRLAELEAALRAGTGARPAALRIVRAPELGYSLGTRLRALAAAAVPPLAALLLRAREARRGVTSLRVRTRNL